MTAPSEDITVTVRHSGKVEVNGLLVAEVGVGRVEGRDELAENLTLHRISRVLLDTIQGAMNGMAEFKDKDRVAIGEGLIDGLLDITVPRSSPPIPGVPPIQRRYDGPYDTGYAYGSRLRRLTAHLDKASDEAVR
jgi:hypothetical protein